MTIKIGNREIGDGQPCFITFEAGPTHDGLDSAKNLVKLAAEAGADAIKFQIFDPDKLVTDKQMARPYEVLEDIEFRRPGYGIAPHTFECLQDLVYSKDLNAGHRLSFADLDES